MNKLLPVLPKLDDVLPGVPNAELKKTVEQTLARLDEIADVELLVELQRQARALTDYFSKSEQQSLTMKSAQLRIARRIGEVLTQTVRPGNPQLSKDTTIGQLPEAVTRDQSSKWQKLAEMPKEFFEDYLANAKKPSLNGVLRHAIQSAGSNEEGKTVLYCGPDELDFMIQRGMKFHAILTDAPWD